MKSLVLIALFAISSTPAMARTKLSVIAPEISFSKNFKGELEPTIAEAIVEIENGLERRGKFKITNAGDADYEIAYKIYGDASNNQVTYSYTYNRKDNRGNIIQTVTGVGVADAGRENKAWRRAVQGLKEILPVAP
jgi:hypothetical protein